MAEVGDDGGWESLPVKSLTLDFKGDWAFFSRNGSGRHLWIHFNLIWEQQPWPFSLTVPSGFHPSALLQVLILPY